MPKRIIVVRHGETDHNLNHICQGQLDTPLNGTGLSQARKVGELLRSMRFDAAYSSDLQRAQVTASAIVRHHTIPLVTTPLLRERHFGVLQGKRRGEIEKVARTVLQKGWRALHTQGQEYGVETNEEMKKRLQEFQKQLHKHADQIVLVVAHGGPIRIFLTLYGMDEVSAYDVEIQNTAVFEVIKDGKRHRIEKHPTATQP